MLAHPLLRVLVVKTQLYFNRSVGWIVNMEYI